MNNVRAELEDKMRQKEGMLFDEEEETEVEEEEIVAEEEPMGLMSRREE